MGPLDLDGPPFGGPLNPCIGCSRCWGHSLDLEHRSHWSPTIGTLLPLVDPVWAEKVGRGHAGEGQSGESRVRPGRGRRAALHLGPGYRAGSRAGRAQCVARSTTNRRSTPLQTGAHQSLRCKALPLDSSLERLAIDQPM